MDILHINLLKCCRYSGCGTWSGLRLPKNGNLTKKSADILQVPGMWQIFSSTPSQKGNLANKSDKSWTTIKQSDCLKAILFINQHSHVTDTDMGVNAHAPSLPASLSQLSLACRYQWWCPWLQGVSVMCTDGLMLTLLLRHYRTSCFYNECVMWTQGDTWAAGVATCVKVEECVWALVCAR